MKQKTVNKKVHWPTLNTIIMVEETLQNTTNNATSVADLKRKLPRKVNHNTLRVILEYLEKSSKIKVSLKGIAWTSQEKSSK